MGGIFKSLFGIKDAPTPPPPVKPVAPTISATFKPGDEGAKKAKKLTAVKAGKGRLSKTLQIGTKSGVNKGYK